MQAIERIQGHGTTVHFYAWSCHGEIPDNYSRWKPSSRLLINPSLCSVLRWCHRYLQQRPGLCGPGFAQNRAAGSVAATRLVDSRLVRLLRLFRVFTGSTYTGVCILTVVSQGFCMKKWTWDKYESSTGPRAKGNPGRLSVSGLTHGVHTEYYLVAMMYFYFLVFTMGTEVCY